MKQVILIPHWVHESLARRKLPFSECLNFEAIKPLTSVNDLICFLDAQELMSALIGEPRGTWSYFLLDRWMKSAQGANKTFLEQTILPRMNATDSLTELEGRLFSLECRLPHHVEPFSVIDITPEAAGVVIYPGFFTAENGTDGYRSALIVEVLKVLYAYNAYHEVSTTPLFKRYLESLSGKQLTV